MKVEVKLARFLKVQVYLEDALAPEQPWGSNFERVIQRFMDMRGKLRYSKYHFIKSVDIADLGRKIIRKAFTLSRKLLTPSTRPGFN